MIHRLPPPSTMPPVRQPAATRAPARPDSVARPMPDIAPRQDPQLLGPPAVAPEEGGLSREETQMIRRYFPDSPTMTLRLYGPGRQADAVNPGAVGSRLDIHG